MRGPLLGLTFTISGVAAQPLEARFRTQPAVVEVYQQVSSADRPGHFLGTSDRSIWLDAQASQLWLVFRAAGYQDRVVAVAPAYFRQRRQWPERGLLELTPNSHRAWLVWGPLLLGVGWVWRCRPRRPGLLAGYELLQEVGRGGGGTVYRARVLNSRESPVALKVFHESDGLRPQPSEHSGLVQIYHQGQIDGLAYQVMEWVGGGTLRQRLQPSGVPRATARLWLERLAEALQWAHRQGFVHGDLKPENVLFSETGTLKLADFAGCLGGTPAYRSPEQLSGASVGPWTDQYGLALLAYEMLTGSIPAGLTRTLHPLPALCEGSLSCVLQRMSQPEPVDRYPDLARAAQELLECL